MNLPSASSPGARTPPHSLDAEESLVGALLLSREAVATAVDIGVSSADFHHPLLAVVFDACLALYTQGAPVDVVTVADTLRGLGSTTVPVPSRPELERIQAATPASANAGHYARTVRDLAALRRLISVGGEIAELGFASIEDVDATLDEAEALVFAVADKRVSTSTARISETTEWALDRLDALVNRTQDPDCTDPHLVGVSSGLPELDRILLGLQDSNLVVVAARPGVGKSAFALSIATHVAVRGQRPVLFASLEMGALELTNRIYAAEAMVDAQHLQTGQLTEIEWSRLTSAIGQVASAPLLIDDNPHCTTLTLRAKARRAKASFGDLGLVVVDYLQLMTTPSARRPESRQVEVAEISRGLKILARELACPVLALSQLNRNLEQRADKRPLLSDLRESGSIEQDADVVVTLFRPDLYEDDPSLKGILEVAVAKHRNGPTGTARLAFVDRYAKVASLEPSTAPPPPRGEVEVTPFMAPPTR